MEVKSEAVHVENKQSKRQIFVLFEVAPSALILITFRAMMVH